MSDLPTLCDARERCCGTPACLNAGLWENDPYDEPIFVQGHSHAEPICAWPDCQTYLTRSAMATKRKSDASDEHQRRAHGHLPAETPVRAALAAQHAETEER